MSPMYIQDGEALMLTVPNQAAYQNHLEHFLQVRISEPCSRSNQ